MGKGNCHEPRSSETQSQIEQGTKTEQIKILLRLGIKPTPVTAPNQISHVFIQWN